MADNSRKLYYSSGADKSQKVLESLISVRDQLKDLKAQLSGLV